MASDTAINGVTALNDYPIMEQGGSCPSLVPFDWLPTTAKNDSGAGSYSTVLLYRIKNG